MRSIKIICVMMLGSLSVHAQSDELQQLMLDIEKLTQFKSILSEMKQGYQIYAQGYGTISSLSKGNFDLHHLYLTGLLAVSPAVRDNPLIRQIISQQNSLLSEYKRYSSLFKQSGSFSRNELLYFNRVFDRLVKQSDANIGELTEVTTADQLRMSDDDRLRAIGRICRNSSGQLSFLRYFNRKAVLLSLQRSKDLHETQTLKKLYGL